MTDLAPATAVPAPARALLDGTAIAATALTVHWDDIAAVSSLDLTVRRGSIAAVLGPNGAGKSTLFSVLTTLKRPSGGSVRIFGDDVVTHPQRIRAGLGVVFQEPTLDRELSVTSNLMMHARLYGMRRREARARVADVLEDFGLEDRARQRVDRLSGGLARRVELARAVLHRPRLLILDEPTVGLDPQARHQLWADVRAMQQQRSVTVVYSTHYMDEAEHADHVLMLGGGRCVAQGSPAQLKDQLFGSRIVLLTSDDAVAAELLSRSGFAAAAGLRGVHVQSLDPERDIPVAVSALSGVTVRGVRVEKPTMDDVFISLSVSPGENP